MKVFFQSTPEKVGIGLGTWLMPIIPTIRRLEQVHGYKDKITLDYEVRLLTPSKKKSHSG